MIHIENNGKYNSFNEIYFSKDVWAYGYKKGYTMELLDLYNNIFVEKNSRDNELNISVILNHRCVLLEERLYKKWFTTGIKKGFFAADE